MNNKLHLLNEEAKQLVKFLRIAAENLDNPYEIVEFCDANSSTCPPLAKLAHEIRSEIDESVQHYHEIEKELQFAQLPAQLFSDIKRNGHDA